MSGAGQPARMRIVPPGEPAGWTAALAASARAWDDPAQPIEWPASLSHLAALFDLDRAEGDLLVMAVAAELDPAGSSGRSGSFRLGLARGMDWAALTPGAPLRRWRLLRPEGIGPLADRPLALDERVLHHLLGLEAMDATLAALVRDPPHAEPPAPFLPLVERIVDALPRTWIALGEGGAMLRGEIAAEAARRLHRPLHLIDARAIPEAAEEAELLATLWAREARLSRRLLLIEGGDHRARALAERIGAGAILSADTPAGDAPCLVTVPRLDRAQQAILWREAGQPGRRAARLAATFDLAAADIARAAASGGAWQAARATAGDRIAGLAERITPRARWRDLVLPDATMRQVRTVAQQARHRATVFDSWGAARDPTRGIGLAALFAGPSGTGKSLAAEVVARALSLDLCRVDLSQLVSKYIGETEKNIAAVCAAAEACGAVLLFDEADALFGKRSEVKDAHDRHANVEVSYLLQRMESYRGLAILTTNLADHIDEAFLRRLRFIISFPPPEAAERARIWAGAFPPRAPVEGLDVARLAQLQATGGIIRNVALSAMFGAAAARRPITMAGIAEAAAAEYEKLGRTLHPSEIEGWA